MCCAAVSWEGKLGSVKHKGVIEGHVMSVTTEDDPFALVHGRGVPVATGGLLVVNDAHLDGRIVLLSGSTSLEGGEVKVAGV